MLGAQAVAGVLEGSLERADMLAYALLSPDGVVLESREQRARAADQFPAQAGADESFRVSSKLQTKIYGLYAAELWQRRELPGGDPDDHGSGGGHGEGAEWLGAEAHDRRLVVCATREDLNFGLLLVVGSSEQAWGEISRHALAAAEQLARAKDAGDA